MENYPTNIKGRNRRDPASDPEGSLPGPDRILDISVDMSSSSSLLYSERHDVTGRVLALHRTEDGRGIRVKEEEHRGRKGRGGAAKSVQGVFKSKACHWP